MGTLLLLLLLNCDGDGTEGYSAGVDDRVVAVTTLNTTFGKGAGEGGRGMLIGMGGRVSVPFAFTTGGGLVHGIDRN